MKIPLGIKWHSCYSVLKNCPIHIFIYIRNVIDQLGGHTQKVKYIYKNKKQQSSNKHTPFLTKCLKNFIGQRRIT